MTRRTLIPLLALLALAAPSAAWAQRPGARPAPFARLDVGVGAVREVDAGLVFHDSWRPGEGFAASVRTPFYVGTAAVGVSVLRYAARTDAVPNFDAVLAHVGWGMDVAWSRLGAYGGVRAGIHRMSFDDDTFVGVRNESELALGVAGRVRLAVVRGVALWGEAAWTKTYTYVRLQQVTLSGGVSVRFRTPGPLRRVLE